MSRAKCLAGAVSLSALIALGSCQSAVGTASEPSASDAYTAAIEAATRPASAEEIAAAERSDPLTRANFWGEEYRKDAANLDTTIAFMRALRDIGSHERVLEIAAKALPIHPRSHALHLETGRALMASKKPGEAAQAFVRAADLAPPDEAAPLAALGVAFDQLEQHTKAQDAYRYALERDPDRVSTLSNYGLSLALSGNLDTAEIQLRRAAALPGADVRVRQNLALVLGLQGRYDEMVAVDPDAPRRTVDANRQALKAMTAPSRAYQDLLSAVPDEAGAPGIPTPMPDTRAAKVESADMPALDLADRTGTGAGATSGNAEPEDASGGAVLRPRLRGSQGR